MKFVNCQPEVPSLVHEIGVGHERPGTHVAYSICFVDRAANEASSFHWRQLVALIDYTVE